MQNWLNSLVASTAFKYLIAMAATWLATKLGVESAKLEGILSQLVGIAMGAWGMWESSRNKAVIKGVKVDLDKASPVTKAEITKAVEKEKGLPASSLST